MRAIFFLFVLLCLAETSHIGHAKIMPITKDVHTSHEGSLEITSDSKDYCSRLDRALTKKLKLPHGVPVGIVEDVRTLQERGKFLCGQGFVRGALKGLGED
ncbi:hypothetical protein GT348_06850 [Aristophania vespae]|uniref:Uncharacterized protein n=1 Tax=Aristophania vespae TaxID=2697033 RepID=A0A6P1NJY5_9PROT|nr:hypothetical protein [Aristophania vespae]QHI95992.1 hypothetical protein GT348_06850 [Aristophania vespae]